MIRIATFQDLDRIDEIAVDVIRDMKASNIPQWDESYPRKEHYQEDVPKQALFVYEQDGLVIGAMTAMKEQDPPYETITGWLVPHGQSLVLHRVIVDPKYRRLGVFQSLLDYAIEVAQLQGYRSIKIDTHQDNYKMRGFLEKNNFQYIGYLKVINREAYELLLEESQ